MINKYTSWTRCFLTGLLVICIFLTCVPVASADEGNTGSDGTFEWIELADGSVEITKYLNSEQNVTIPDQLGGKDVTAIGFSAFQNNITLRALILSDNIVTIGSRAFNNCQCLTSVTWSTNLETIGDQAFYRCGFTSISLPDKLKTMGAYAFSACSNLETITIPASVKDIGERVFVSCSKLKTLILSTGLSSIGYRAFDSCKLLDTIAVSGTVPVEGTCKFPNTLTSIGIEAFQYCEGLLSVDIPDNIKTIESGTFKGCKSFASVTLPEGLTAINDFAFYQCVLPEVTLPSTLTTLAGQAFGFNPLSEISIPSGITNIGNGAFIYCSLLTSVTLPSGLQSIGNSVFSDCSQLPSITLPSGLQSIGTNAFTRCSQLTDITIPSGVTKIENSAFYQCTSLKSITLHDGITSIGASAFHDCTALESFSMPPLVNFIHSRAFKNCSLIPQLTIPEGVSSIQPDTFSGCSMLNNVTIPSTVDYIGPNAFSDCDRLEKAIFLRKSIYMKENLFANTAINDDGIYGLSGGSAQAYATNNGHPFHVIYAVSFDSQGGSSVPDMAAPDGTIDAPDEPTKTSCVFGGWYETSECNGEKVSFPYSVTADVELYAEWLDGYTVTFDSQGGSAVDEKTVQQGSAVQAPEATTRAGYVFDGWYKTAACNDEDKIYFPYLLPGDVTLYAKWLDAYTVTFDSQGGSSVAAKTAVQGTAIIAPDAPTNTDYVFDGWYETEVCDGARVVFPYTGTSDILLYAKWLSAYTVTFDSLGGSSVASKTAVQGTAISAPETPTQDGYVFDGWYETTACDGAEVVFPYTDTSDITLYAKWLDAYTVTFDSQGGSSVAGKTAVQGTAISAPETPTRNGYVFNGWYETSTCDGAEVVFPYTGTSDITLYAKWLDIYTVTFDSQGGSVVVSSKGVNGVSVNEPNAPTKAGYVFDGWYKTAACDGHKVYFPYTITGDVTLYSKWLQAYQITLILPSGSVIIEGNTIDEPEEPARNGYIFEGWYKTPACDGQQVTFPCAITGDTALYPKWTLVENQLITIVGTLLDENGEPLEGYTVELHSTPRTALTDSRGKYTFADVEIADHSLTVKDTSGVMLKSFAVAVKSEDKFAWSKPDDDSITVLVQEDTASINVTIKLGKDGEVTVDKIENVVNPQTGDVQHNLVWVLAILAVLIGCAVVILKRRTV